MITYSLSATSTILRSDGASIPPDPLNTDYQAYLSWVAAGNTAAPYVVPAPKVSDYEEAVQAVVDNYAVLKGYQDGTTMASYSTSTVTAWATEAQKFVQWRDQCFTVAYTALQAVNAGTTAAPSIAALIAALPAHP